jgi:hypothetical protein
VAAPTNLCELALGQTPFGRCHGNCLNAALVLRDRPQLRNIGRLTCGRVCARLALWDGHSRRLISFAELPRSKGRLIRDMLLENDSRRGKIGNGLHWLLHRSGQRLRQLEPSKARGHRCGRLQGLSDEPPLITRGQFQSYSCTARRRACNCFDRDFPTICATE